MASNKPLSFQGLLALLLQGLTCSVSNEARLKCHTGVRDAKMRCMEYANIVVREDGRAGRVRRQGEEEREEDGEDVKPPPPEPLDEDDYPALEASCLNVTWETATQSNSWGSCMNMTLDQEYRYSESLYPAPSQSYYHGLRHYTRPPLGTSHLTTCLTST